jgi:DNA-directed RNA polymerase
LDKTKQIQAVIPNIIHSLDASHLIKIILSAHKDKFKPIISVHDCFGTLPNLMKNLDYRVKKEFVELYSQSEFLNNFHQRFIQSIKDNQFDIIDQDKKSFVVLDKGRNKRFFDLYPKELLEIPILPLPGNLNLNIITKSKSIFGFSVLIYFDTNLLFNIGENLIN